MHKNFPLQPLVNLAQQKNDAAAKKLGQLNQQQQAAQAKLDTLLRYLDDYRARFQKAALSGMDKSELQNFQEFINRLDEAIAQQRIVIEKTNHSVQAGIDELHNTKRTMKSFDTLSQRHFASEKKVEEKAEQRMQDEHAGHFAARKRANLDEA
jgi:flagellar protein FliJ